MDSASLGALTGDGLLAGGALLGEVSAEALLAQRLLVLRREARAGQHRAALRAREALLVPRLVLICHAARHDDLRDW